jgi:hypothetical protein
VGELRKEQELDVVYIGLLLIEAGTIRLASLLIINRCGCFMIPAYVNLAITKVGINLF